MTEHVTMKSVLLLGGTNFIGAHIAQALSARGHQVTTFSRGVTAIDPSPGIERLHGDRDQGANGLSALNGRRWDACIDLSGYLAPQVRASTTLLQDTVEHYVFISAVRVYGDPPRGPVDESFPLVEAADEDVHEIDDHTYPRLKVRCEQIVQELFANRWTILRPQITTGPGDPSGRYTYWVRRAELPGPMLLPGDGTDHLQVVDVRDIARFACLCVERRVSGTFNTCGSRMTWSQFAQMLGASDVAWVPADVLQRACVSPFELPVFRPRGGAYSALMEMSSDRAIALGYEMTAPDRTLADVRQWLVGRDLELPLSRDRENELMTAARVARSVG